MIKGNVFSRNGDEGILVEGGARYRMTRNRFVRNGGGITLGPSNNVVAHNRIVGGNDGIRVEKGHDNLVAANLVVAHSARRHHARNSRTRSSAVPHNVVRGNVVRGSRVDGIAVVEKDRHSALMRNVVTGPETTAST